MFITSRKQRGFTLLEVLVALIILSIGVLGTAKLQLIGLRGTSDANLQGQATLLANDMAERIRANRQAALVGNYTDLDFSTLNCSSVTATCSDTKDTEALDCSAIEMARFDGAQWACQISNQIPNATPSLTKAGDAIEVQVSWPQLQIDGTEVTENVSISVLY